jgi:hypothetical protein
MLSTEGVMVMVRCIVSGVLGGVLAAGVVLAVVPHSGGPRGCSDPSLPSGDAVAVTVSGAGDGSAWRLPHAGREFVCTDGTWVRVSGYGR